MARSRINGYGEVVLKMSVHEAQALHALLARIEPITGEAIHEATEETFLSLERTLDDVEEPNPFDAFRNNPHPLVEQGDSENVYDYSELDPHLYDPEDLED